MAKWSPSLKNASMSHEASGLLIQMTFYISQGLRSRILKLNAELVAIINLVQFIANQIHLPKQLAILIKEAAKERMPSQNLLAQSHLRLWEDGVPIPTLFDFYGQNSIGRVFNF